MYAGEAARMRDREDAHRAAEVAILYWNELRKAMGLSLRSTEGEPPPIDMEPLFNGPYIDGWIIEASRAKSPRLSSSDTSAFLLSRTNLSGDGEISVDIKRPDTAGQAALVFGARGEDDFFIFEVAFHERATDNRVVAYHWTGKELKRLAAENFDLSKAQRASWITHALQIESRRMTGFVAGKKVLSFSCPRKPVGTIGFYISAASAYKGPVLYRRLLVRKAR